MNVFIYESDVYSVQANTFTRGLILQLRGGNNLYLFLDRDEAAELDRALRTIYPTLAQPPIAQWAKSEEEEAFDKWVTKHEQELRRQGEAL